MTREDQALAVLIAAAVVAIAAGAALIYAPAGPIVAGALVLGVVAAYVRGAAHEPEPAPTRRARPRRSE